VGVLWPLAYRVAVEVLGDFDVARALRGAKMRAATPSSIRLRPSRMCSVPM
jgi:hypothetical protein